MEEKRRLRETVRARRAERVAAAEIPVNAVTAQLATLTAQLHARRVACFVSVRGEPDTTGYLAWAVEHGIEVLLPRSLADGTLDWAVHQTGAFAPGAFGIPEPTGASAPGGAAGSADLLLIPAAAVDRSGTRLGWGRGFFDRELALLPTGPGALTPPVFAVVWEDEVLDRLPAEHHDVPVHGAVTEETIHRFG
ncbi:5-formyltetrahydrofolate cyclo-ligase [Leucobacter sp. G161]|uniref:5-formyltetrahydrofolate cyclo-ligase n=1 Tax=Leucobacter sp. G161 TaxID=663704 RepID=UPI00073C0C44|nr:5-formyltetrahydrofolate cyclo-ligase [Leucobacter sp. G161]KUF06296.1 hypothetical protein AUL38_13945 [Leucobacter sp. G161]